MKTKSVRSIALRVLGYIAVCMVVLLLVLATTPILFAPIASRSNSASICMSNMKQIGLGFIEYAQDYDEKWPSGSGHWAGALYSYEKSTGVYHCPEDPTRTTAAPAYAISYAMNGNLVGLSNAALSAPAATVAATDFAGTPPCNFPVLEGCNACRVRQCSWTRKAVGADFQREVVYANVC